MSYSGNLLVENRNGLIVNAMVWEASGTAERNTALVMLGALRDEVGGLKAFVATHNSRPFSPRSTGRLHEEDLLQESATQTGSDQLPRPASAGIGARRLAMPDLR